MNHSDKITQLKKFASALNLKLTEENLECCHAIFRNNPNMPPESLVAILDEIIKHTK